MNIKRFAIATISVFVFFFFYEWIVHGFLLTSLYESTPGVWRSGSEMMRLFFYTVLWQLILAVLMTLIYIKYVKPGIFEGLLFGIFWGAFAGLMWVGLYPYLPIHFTLASSWFFSSLLEGIGAGIILAATYRKN